MANVEVRLAQRGNSGRRTSLRDQSIQRPVFQFGRAILGFVCPERTATAPIQPTSWRSNFHCDQFYTLPRPHVEHPARYARGPQFEAVNSRLR